MKFRAVLFALAIGLLNISLAFSQTNLRNYNTESEAYQYLSHIKKGDSVVFSHSEAPGFCYTGGKNPLKALTFTQETALSGYGYPNFVSYGIGYLERDILRFKRAVTFWNKSNTYREAQIREDVGFAK